VQPKYGFFVMRHQAGRSSRTLISVLRISNTPPGGTALTALRINSSRPEPQSRLPPSHTASGRISSGACTTSSMGGYPLVGHARATGGQKFDRFGATDDDSPRHELMLVQLALLEARRADPDAAASIDKIGQQLFQRGKAFFMDIIGVTLLR